MHFCAWPGAAARGSCMVLGRLRLKQHDYDFPPYRPPSEASSLLLRVTRGCPWNKCTFCSMYKHIRFERRPLAEIKEDIQAARYFYSDVARTVFLGDSNSLVITADDFVEILELLRTSFPHLERITSYARAKTLCKKSPAELRRLRQAGLSRLHVGLETGDAALLEEIRKGAAPDDFVAAGRKAHEAGFELSVYVLLGIGGEARWREHARGTAAVLNRINPHFIRVRTLQPQPGCPLYDGMLSGSFVKAAHATVLHEQREIIARLEVTSRYLSDHITNYLAVDGTLPADKEKMLRVIDDCLAELEHNETLKMKFTRKYNLRQL